MLKERKNPEKIVENELGWRKIEGSNNYYVSADGRVGRRLYENTYRLIKPKAHPAGYVQHHIGMESGKRKTILLHTLVASAFIGKRPPNMVTNHKNGIKTDNRVENLEWMTRSENSLHAYRTGLVKEINHVRGEQVESSKLTEDAVRLIYNCDFLSYTRLAFVFGVDTNTIACVKNGRSWKHITNHNLVP